MATNISEPSQTKNPSLKKYFKYMVNSRKLTIQFTQSKIREIITTDLNINFSEFSELLKDVSTEAFAFYIQGWPGWQTENFQKCIDKPEEMYIKFKNYLKGKLVQLQEKENEFVLKDEKTQELRVKGNTVLPPDEIFTQKSAFKTRYPYTLEISGPAKFVSLLSVESTKDAAMLSLKTPATPVRSKLSNTETVNHPYVSVQFKMPNLMKFTRKNVHKLEMFLCKPTDMWTFPKQDHILDIRHFPSRHNIYSAKCLQAFFNKLLFAVCNYNHHISEDKKNELACVCTEFLNDIYEANLNFSTIQECTEICYSIGDSMYYCDSATSDDPINLRKIYSPQVSYSLVFCALLQTDIRDDGSFEYFDFLTEESSPSQAKKESSFINDINLSLHYHCNMCNQHYSKIEELKTHLLTTHPSTDILRCTVCRNDCYMYDLLQRRWRHDCKGKDNTNKA